MIFVYIIVMLLFVFLWNCAENIESLLYRILTILFLSLFLVAMLVLFTFQGQKILTTGCNIITTKATQPDVVIPEISNTENTNSSSPSLSYRKMIRLSQQLNNKADDNKADNETFSDILNSEEMSQSIHQAGPVVLVFLFISLFCTLINIKGVRVAIHLIMFLLMFLLIIICMNSNIKYLSLLESDIQIVENEKNNTGKIQQIVQEYENRIKTENYIVKTVDIVNNIKNNGRLLPVFKDETIH